MLLWLRTFKAPSNAGIAGDLADAEVGKRWGKEDFGAKKHCTSHVKKSPEKNVEVQKPPQAPMPGHRKWGTKEAFRKRVVHLHSWMKKIKMELVHCYTSAMTNMSPIYLQLRPRERGNSEETDIRLAVLQAGNGPKNGQAWGWFVFRCLRPVSGLCRRPCQRFPPQAIRNQGSDMRPFNGGAGAGGCVVVVLVFWRSLPSLNLDSYIGTLLSTL